MFLLEMFQIPQMFLPEMFQISQMFVLYVKKLSPLGCLIREKVVTFRMVKLNLLLSIFCITK